jgi:hypothetical protein
MGLEKNEGRRIFLNVSDGQIVRQHQSPIEGVTVTRENKNKKVVHEEFFRAVTGVVTDIKSKETPFGMVWEISLQDGDDDYVLSFNYSSKYTSCFFRAAPNVDFGAPLTINPWSMKDKKDATKTVIGLSLYQHVAGHEKKQKVEFAYTRENPGEMPDLVKRKIKGKDTYDDSDQLDFFEKMVKETILPQLGNGVKKGSFVAAGADDVTDPNEDLPF